MPREMWVNINNELLDQLYKVYGEENISERHSHRYEINNKFRHN